jgi:hypothetical protein
MKRKQSRTNAEKKLNKRAIRRTLRGYARANKSIEAEKRAWLSRLTIEQARQVFDDLHQDADAWKQFGGDLQALEQRRIASKIAGRRIFMRLSQRSTK